MRWLTLCGVAAQIACQDIINTQKSLPPFPHLRSVRLSFLAEEDASDLQSGIFVPSFLPRSIRQLFACNPQPSLETLQVLMRWHPTVDPLISSQFLNGQPVPELRGGEWQEFDQMLSDEERFPRVRTTLLETRYRFPFQLMCGEAGCELTEEARVQLKARIIAALPMTARRMSELVVEVCPE